MAPYPLPATGLSSTVILALSALFWNPPPPPITLCPNKLDRIYRGGAVRCCCAATERIQYGRDRRHVEHASLRQSACRRG